jgi:hypothetical protein
MEHNMKKILLIISTFVITSMTTSAEELTFGEAINESVQVKISTLLAAPENYLNKDVTVTGTIVSVCSHRGCWMELASDARFEKLRIKVRDGDMVFPLHAKGRQALATGKLKAIALNLEQTKKYKTQIAKRRGETLDVASITSPMSIYQLSPIGVKVLD